MQSDIAPVSPPGELDQTIKSNHIKFICHKFST